MCWWLKKTLGQSFLLLNDENSDSVFLWRCRTQYLLYNYFDVSSWQLSHILRSHGDQRTVTYINSWPVTVDLYKCFRFARFVFFTFGENTVIQGDCFLAHVTNCQCLRGNWTTRKCRQSFSKSSVYDIGWKLGEQLSAGNSSSFVLVSMLEASDVKACWLHERLVVSSDCPNTRRL